MGKGDSAKNVTAIGGGECPSGRQAKGTITKWIPGKRFGFIKMDGGEKEVFVGRNDVWDPARQFNEGDRVEFDIKVKGDGKMSALYCTFEGKEIDRRCKKREFSTNPEEEVGKVGELYRLKKRLAKLEKLTKSNEK